MTDTRELDGSRLARIQAAAHGFAPTFDLFAGVTALDICWLVLRAGATSTEGDRDAAIMDAIEQTVEACAKQWSDDLPGEAWVVDYATILAKAKLHARVVGSRATPAVPPSSAGSEARNG